MKKKKKIIVAIGVVAVIAIGAFFFLSGKKTNTNVQVQTTALSKSSLSNIVSTSGVVQSTDSINIYSDLTYAVTAVNVKVGDHVNAGDVLSVLDSKDVKDTIAQKQAAFRTSAAQASQKIDTSEKTYTDTKSTLTAGLNTELNNANDKVTSAKRDLETAQLNESNAKKHLSDNTNSTLISAKSAVESAKLALDNATEKYNDAKKDYKDNGDDLSKETLDSARQTMQSAQLSYDSAVKTLNAQNTASDESLATLANAVTTAQTNYDSAVKAQQATKISVDQSLDTAQQNITSNMLSADQTASQKELDALQTKLKKCTITAPSSGTITAVYAVKNAPATSLMFVIEDTNALKMSVKIKEYDIGSVKVGMKAVLKADAVSGKTFEGVLQKIAPTSVKGKDGATESSTDAEFEADIVVTSKDVGLLIGMNGTADIILEKKDSIYAVPFDAVTTDAQGKSIVYTITAQKDGTYKTTSIPVTVGIETDSEIEISGSGLKDGLKIVSEGKQITEGSTVKLAGAKGESNASESSGTSK